MTINDQVEHIDGDLLNNDLANLRVVPGPEVTNEPATTYERWDAKQRDRDHTLAMSALEGLTYAQVEALWGGGVVGLVEALRALATFPDMAAQLQAEALLAKLGGTRNIHAEIAASLSRAEADEMKRIMGQTLRWCGPGGYRCLDPS